MLFLSSENHASSILVTSDKPKHLSVPLLENVKTPLGLAAKYIWRKADFLKNMWFSQDSDATNI